MKAATKGWLFLLLSMSCVQGHAQVANVESELVRLVGEDAVRCGSYRGRAPGDWSIADDDHKRAIECARTAWHEGKPFFFAAEIQGIDSRVGRGMLGLRARAGLYRIEYDSAPCGGPGCPPAVRLSSCGATSVVDPSFEAACRLRLARTDLVLPPLTEPPVVRARPACSVAHFKLPEDFVVLAAGAYSGRRLDYQIDQKSRSPATQIDVTVNRTDKPVVLMLGAYDANIWNISWSEKTRIAGVLVSGYRRQVIAGLDPRIPTLVSTHDEKGACGYFYVAPDKLDALNPTSSRLFGRNVEMAYIAQEGKVVVGDAPGQGQKLVTSSVTTPESFYDRSAPRAGNAGLNDAIAKGQLRKATQEDADAWEQALQAQGRIPPVSGGKSSSLPEGMLRRAYVVLQPFVFPAGLHGGYLAVFYIPKGVPRPTGNAGHSAILDFNTMACEGAVCKAIVNR